MAFDFRAASAAARARARRRAPIAAQGGALGDPIPTTPRRSSDPTRHSVIGTPVAPTAARSLPMPQAGTPAALRPRSGSRTRTNASGGNPAAAAVSRVSAAVARTARSTPSAPSTPAPRPHRPRESTPALAQSAPRSTSPAPSAPKAANAKPTYRAGTIAAKAQKSGAKFESFDKSVSSPAMKNFLATHPWARQSKDKALVKQVVASLLAKEKKIPGAGAMTQRAAQRRFGNF